MFLYIFTLFYPFFKKKGCLASFDKTAFEQYLYYFADAPRTLMKVYSPRISLAAP